MNDLSRLRISAQCKLRKCQQFDATMGRNAGDRCYDIPDDLYEELIKARLCPCCAALVGHPVPRLTFEKGDRENYPAWVCYQCDEAFDVQHAPHDSDREPDYGGVLTCAGTVVSDADSGL